MKTEEGRRAVFILGEARQGRDVEAYAGFPSVVPEHLLCIYHCPEMPLKASMELGKGDQNSKVKI